MATPSRFGIRKCEIRIRNAKPLRMFIVLKWLKLVEMPK